MLENSGYHIASGPVSTQMPQKAASRRKRLQGWRCKRASKTWAEEFGGLCPQMLSCWVYNWTRTVDANFMIQFVVLRARTTGLLLISGFPGRTDTKLLVADLLHRYHPYWLAAEAVWRRDRRVCYLDRERSRSLWLGLCDLANRRVKPTDTLALLQYIRTKHLPSSYGNNDVECLQ